MNRLYTLSIVTIIIGFHLNITASNHIHKIQSDKKTEEQYSMTFEEALEYDIDSFTDGIKCLEKGLHKHMQLLSENPLYRSYLDRFQAYVNNSKDLHAMNVQILTELATYTPAMRKEKQATYQTIRDQQLEDYKELHEEANKQIKLQQGNNL